MLQILGLSRIEAVELKKWRFLDISELPYSKGPQKDPCFSITRASIMPCLLLSKLGFTKWRSPPLLNSLVNPKR